MINAGKHFLRALKMDKTTYLSQKCPKMAFRKFCSFDRRRFKQKRL